MTVRPLFGFLCASLDDFLMKPLNIVGESGASAVAILDANQPVFYVVSPDAWREMSKGGRAAFQTEKINKNENEEVLDESDDLDELGDLYREQVALVPAPRAKLSPRKRSVMTDSVLTQGALRANNFDVLADQLIAQENQRVQRGELSAASVGILKNRLDAHVLPYFKYIPPSQVTPVMMDAFVKRLTDAHLSSTTVSQYLVVVRK